MRLGELGQSPWYDYITRDLVTTGELARLIAEDGLRGMTSNPTIFEKAIAGSRLYDDEIRALADAGRSAAGDLRAPRRGRRAGRVRRLRRRVRGDRRRRRPGLARGLARRWRNDTDATIHEAERLWRAVDRPNAMIKIPGTAEGLPAITHCIAAGISVNVTLLFSVERYAEVIEAFLAGLERRLDGGLPLRPIASVASFFVSRVDGKVDPLLDRLGDPHAPPRDGSPSPTRARPTGCSSGPSARRGGTAWPRRAPGRSGRSGPRPAPRTPRYPDVHYVEALVAPRTVNTLPPETFAAYRDHGRPAVRIQEGVAAAPGPAQGAGRRSASIWPRSPASWRSKASPSSPRRTRSLLAGIEAKAGALVGR